MAVKPPEAVIDAVAAAVAPARSVRAGLRWEPRERYHLTLQFLGAVRQLAPVVEGLASALSGREAFALRLGGAGAFPKPGRARVVWIGAAVGGEEVAGLAGAVAGALGPLGYEPDRKEFHPHLTVARLKVPDDVGDVLAALGAGPLGEAFTVAELVLYQSVLSAKGPTYTVLERFPLGNA
ncbi:MAG TPA: RNA 2',3'-cyclic phosphodiesterase [Acidimicrobiia bacterium]|nr:RNA 2',3'-cyclic phosphodiesterase [Acidimicrobiia bacterium]HZQ77216.1 RNA 2',3'-cyclic phosphodiesterase [Acidimicrobiia bacterium]